jgi:hypothetical protein
MTSNEATKRDGGSISAEEIAKAFAALPVGMLQCLVCGEICTLESARGHSEVDCSPSIEFLFA